jgi:ribulose-5-phosphate 4-epimerase/fuculose-1-phosphate aldolase
MPMTRAGKDVSVDPQVNPNTESIQEPSDPEAAVLWRKRQLVIGLRLLSQAGLDDGIAGHITARDVCDPDALWVNPLARRFSTVRVRDLLLVDRHGSVIVGNGRVNRAAYAIHAAIHRQRLDVIGSVHSHSVYGKAWSTLGEPLSPLTQDACAFFQDHSVHRRYSGLVFDESDGYEIAASLGANKAVVLQNHGLLTVGASVGAAVWWFLAMERACQCEILARSAGTPIPIDHEAASLTWRQIGGEASGRFIFSSLADELLSHLGGFEALD